MVRVKNFDIGVGLPLARGDKLGSSMPNFDILHYTGKRHQTVCRRTSTKDPLRQPPNMSRRDKSHENCLQDICVCVCVFCTLHISRFSAGAMSRIHVLASTNLDPLQDPHLRIHVSASLCLRVLCKIHVSGFMSQQLLISGSSARSMSPDLIMCPIHVLTSTNMGPLQDPCLRIPISASYQHPYVSQDPLQDPCLRIHLSASFYLGIHILASICISGSFARSMSPDSCLSIHLSGSASVFMSRQPYLWTLSKIRISAFIPVDPAQNRHGARFLWPCARKTLRSKSFLMCRAGETHVLICRDTFLWPCAGETQIWTSGDAFCVALRAENRFSVSRRRNANFDQPRRILRGPA